MQTINFSYNYNGKLHCKNICTIRLQNPKYNVGQTYNLTLFSEDIGPGIIQEIKNFKLVQLTEFMARLDTGYGKAEAQKLIITMYKNTPVDGQPINWDTQMLSMLLIHRPEMCPIPLGYWSLPEQTIKKVTARNQVELFEAH